ncbi:MAG TPA: SDR family oxidoreductase [Candidatus Hydrogenedentes bacterium]|jgi:nucleoside-diphosphate-sugar epimerase|nr:SDR family oxidoreductase [Candidatus Hydrogenedentota bacterium]
MPRVLVSGGAGFLGSHLCDRLLTEDWDVVAVDNLSTGRLRNIDHLLNHPRFRFQKRDITQPFTCNEPLDYVMHLASPASPPDFKTLPLETLRAGSFGTHQLLDLAHTHGARFFLASTSEIYGDPPPEQHPQKEDYWGHVSCNGLRSVYDEAKRYAEAVTTAYHRVHSLDTRIVRIFNTYGPRMRPDDGRVVTNFACQALQGHPLTLYGDGNQTRSFCYVSDLVEGFYRLLISDETGPVNLGTPDEYTVREVAEMIIELTGSPSEIICVPQPFPDDPRRRKPDITRARQVLGWEPEVELRDGLRRTIESLQRELQP